MWVSTGNAGIPYHCDITTLAVLCPTPGRASKLSKLDGTFPSCLVIKIFDKLEIAFDFLGASPHGLMSLETSKGTSFRDKNYVEVTPGFKPTNVTTPDMAMGEEPFDQ